MNDIVLIRVLLVEDNAGDAQLTQITLRHAKEVNFEVTWVESIKKAKEALQNNTFQIRTPSR